MEPLLDRLGRPLETLRISITDRCNFRCVYCMPKEVFGRDYAFLERRELLTLEELARVVGIFAGLGVRTVRTPSAAKIAVTRAISSSVSSSERSRNVWSRP